MTSESNTSNTKYEEILLQNKQDINKLNEIEEDFNNNKKIHLERETPILDGVAQLSLRSIDSPDFLESFNSLKKQLDDLHSLYEREEEKYIETYSSLYEKLESKLNQLKKESQDEQIKERIDDKMKEYETFKTNFINLVKGDYAHSYYDIDQAEKSILEVKNTFDQNKVK
ncbi:hypothetical protein ACO0SA_004318 [Hanseniaspora valbyensis]